MDSMFDPADDPGSDRSPRLSVGDPELRKTRRLARECATCIFKPGNPMHLDPGRLKQMVTEARSDAGYIICHSTLPYAGYPEAKPAICRGFADRYSTQVLQVIERLFGFVEVDSPGEDADGTDDTAPPHDNTTGTAQPRSAG
ncbi:hypothetical protein GA0070616_3225 [Micromonospora nigra]|uniref:Uncharacterized protein n=1 Tax=Micromonospora nigra TaxID=145857 RepID=A0A1C6S9L9_9ACTN|nr:hypothetical protein [Micromonospora nigra]SCL26031.1 hypothetical protein GA0070616_3225 [Micromonospora nigra]